MNEFLKEIKYENVPNLPRRIIHLEYEFPKIICLCGSTRFTDYFHKINSELTLKGNIVLSVGISSHDPLKSLTKEEKEKLDELHKRKIDLCDEIFVINLKTCICSFCMEPTTMISNQTECCGTKWFYGNYIGESTKSEIEYARSLGKKVNYLSEGS